MHYVIAQFQIRCTGTDTGVQLYPAIVAAWLRQACVHQWDHHCVEKKKGHPKCRLTPVWIQFGSKLGPGPRSSPSQGLLRNPARRAQKRTYRVPISPDTGRLRKLQPSHTCDPAQLALTFLLSCVLFCTLRSIKSTLARPPLPQQAQSEGPCSRSGAKTSAASSRHLTLADRQSRALPRQPKLGPSQIRPALVLACSQLLFLDIRGHTPSVHFTGYMPY